MYLKICSQRAMLGRTRGTLSELLRHGSTDETIRLRKVLKIHGSEDKRCTCGEGVDETRRHLRLECSHTKDAAEMVERVASERLAALGCSFYVDVGARIGYWNQGERHIRREIAKAGSPDDGWEQRHGDGLIELWPGNKKTAHTAAVVTRERLGCLGSWWRGRPGRPLRTSIRKLLLSCLRQCHRQPQRRRHKKQDDWTPDNELPVDGQATNDRATESTEGVDGRGTPVDATAWLARMNTAETEALVQDRGSRMTNWQRVCMPWVSSLTPRSRSVQ